MLEAVIASAPSGPCPTPAHNPRWALIVAILGSSMAFLDGTVVNVALPVMQRELGATAGAVQWIVEAYALFLASLVLVGGALGDRLGRRRMFSVGAALFAIASAACGVAPTLALLVVARGVQGIGAALLVPGSLAIISAAYPVSRRGPAIGTWSAFSAVTASIGPVAGGLVVTHASWRWLFFFNVPIAAVILVLANRRVAETRDDEAPAQLDVAGASLVTVGLGLIVYALIDSGGAGTLAAPRTVGLLVAGALALGLFVVAERRKAAPMVPLALFRSRTFAGANLLTFLVYAALGGALFFIPFNLIQVQRYSPAAAGAALVPFVLLVSTMSRRAGGLAMRLGPRPLLVSGALIAAGGFALLALPTTGGSYWATFFPGIVVLGLGMGLLVAPLTTAVMGAVSPRHAGVASGINNAVSRAAGLLAVAGLGVVFFARFNRVLDERLAALALPPAAVAAIEQQRSRMAGVDFLAFAAPLREPLRHAFDGAYAAGFRLLMTACALLASMGALAGFSVEGRSAQKVAPRPRTAGGRAA